MYWKTINCCLCEANKYGNQCMKYLLNIATVMGAALFFEWTFAGETKVRQSLTEPDYVQSETIEKISPTYPKSRARLRHGGLVEILYMVDKHGKPYDLLVTSSTHEDFEAQALQALSKYVYKPATNRGVAVDSSRRLVIKFQMENAVSKVTRDFQRLYRRSEKAIARKEKNQAKVRKLINRLKETPYLSSYAWAYIHLI